MNLVTVIYNSFLWAMALSIIAFGNVWLEMRLNLGWVLGGSWLVLCILLWLGIRKNPALSQFRYTALNSVLCLLYGIILLGTQRLSVVPAAIIREGIGWTKTPFYMINGVLAAVLLLCLVGLFFANIHRKRKA